MFEMKKEQILKDAQVFEDLDEKFRDALSDVLEQILIGTLGKPGAIATFACLEQNYQLKKENIPENLERFHEGMMQMFGSGTFLIEEYIMEKLRAILFCKQRHHRPMHKSEWRLDFPRYIQNLIFAYTNGVKFFHEEMKKE